MEIDIKGFLITSSHEIERQANVAALQNQFPSLTILSAVYPSQTKVPFLSSIKRISQDRTGIALLDGEVGCLLSHRMAWKRIVKNADNENTMYLVLESDSQINALDMIHQNWNKVANQYDLFFWGAWEGNMRLFRSTEKKIGNGYKMGVPFIKTVYCTYGYSLNAKAAKLLLKRTSKFNYQVDQFKYYDLEDSLKIGGVMPEIITNEKGNLSYIQQGRNKTKERFMSFFLNAKNFLICYFK